MDFVDIRTLTVLRKFRPGTRKGYDGAVMACVHVDRDCGIGCSCGADILGEVSPGVALAEQKTLCFNDQKRQGISEVPGSGRAIKEGPDEWVYEVQAKLVEARP